MEVSFVSPDINNSTARSGSLCIGICPLMTLLVEKQPTVLGGGPGTSGSRKRNKDDHNQQLYQKIQENFRLQSNERGQFPTVYSKQCTGQCEGFHDQHRCQNCEIDRQLLFDEQSASANNNHVLNRYLNHKNSKKVKHIPPVIELTDLSSTLNTVHTISTEDGTRQPNTVTEEKPIKKRRKTNFLYSDAFNASSAKVTSRVSSQDEDVVKHTKSEYHTVPKPTRPNIAIVTDSKTTPAQEHHNGSNANELNIDEMMVLLDQSLSPWEEWLRHVPSHMIQTPLASARVTRASAALTNNSSGNKSINGESSGLFFFPESLFAGHDIDELDIAHDIDRERQNQDDNVSHTADENDEEEEQEISPEIEAHDLDLLYEAAVQVIAHRDRTPQQSQNEQEEKTSHNEEEDEDLAGQVLFSMKTRSVTKRKPNARPDIAKLGRNKSKPPPQSGFVPWNGNAIEGMGIELGEGLTMTECYGSIRHRLLEAYLHGDSQSMYQCAMALVADVIFPLHVVNDIIRLIVNTNTVKGPSIVGSRKPRIKEKELEWSICWGVSHRDEEGNLCLTLPTTPSDGGESSNSSSPPGKIDLARLRLFYSVKRHPQCPRYTWTQDQFRWRGKNICVFCKMTFHKRTIKSFIGRVEASYSASGRVNHRTLCVDELIAQYEYLIEESKRLQIQLDEVSVKVVKKTVPEQSTTTSTTPLNAVTCRSKSSSVNRSKASNAPTPTTVTRTVMTRSLVSATPMQLLITEEDRDGSDNNEEDDEEDDDSTEAQSMDAGFQVDAALVSSFEPFLSASDDLCENISTS